MKHLALLIATTLSATGCESSKAGAPSTTEQAAAKDTAPTGKAGAPSTTEQAAAKDAAPTASNARARLRVTVTVTDSGYEPGTIDARASEPLTLVFKRTSDRGCGHQLVFPDRDIRRELPLNQEVEVELTPQKNDTIAFTCGMGMYRGSVVASAQ